MKKRLSTAYVFRKKLTVALQNKNYVSFSIVESLVRKSLIE